MRKTIIFFIVSIFFSFYSCNSNFKKEYDNNGKLIKTYTKINGVLDGELKVYYPSGNIKELHSYQKGKLNNISYYYYDNSENNLSVKTTFLNQDRYKKVSYYLNGKIKDSGLVNQKSQKIGEWFYFNEGDILEFKDEYFIINDEEYLNQTIAYDKNHSVLFSKSKIMDIEVFSDTIYNNEPAQILACIDIGHFIGVNTKAKILLSKGYNNKINNDFSNLNDIDIDTIYNLRLDKINRDNFKDFNQDKCVAFGKWFTNVGENYIRGVLIEYYTDSIQEKENRFYFEKSIYVMDSINDKVSN